MIRLMLLLLAGALPLTGAEVSMVSVPALAVFGGGTRLVPVTIANRSGLPVALEVGLQVLQATTATVAPVGAVAPWKRITIQPHQTLEDQAEVPFPAVRAQTRFFVRFTLPGEILGLAEVWVYPSNLLAELSSILGDEPVLLLSVPNVWKELLGASSVSFLEVPTSASPPPRSKLALVGTAYQPVNQPGDTNTAFALAKGGAGIVWIKPAPIPDAAIEPSYYTLSVSNAAFIIAQENTLTNIAADPWAQLRFLRMARLATGSAPLPLLKLSP